MNHCYIVFHSSTIHIDCITVSTLPVKATIDDHIHKLFDALLSALRRAISSYFQAYLYGSREGHSGASPNSPPKLRRSQLRSFAGVTSEASPESPPKLRRSHLRSFAEVNYEASPKSTPKLRRSQLRSFAEVTSEASPKSSRRPDLHSRGLKQLL